MNRVEELKELILSFKKGGIHIKKENRGKFTSYCGGKVTSECIARGKASSNPAIRKRATFAANARKWKHQEGGWFRKPIIQRKGYEVSYLYDAPIKYVPTIEDLAKFTGGFETFNPNVYQLKTSDGSRIQNLTGYGFSDVKSLALANSGRMTKDIANKILVDTLSKQRKEWLQLLPETAKLPEEALLGLTDTSYNGKGVAATIKTSPKLVKAIKEYIPGNRKSLEAVVKEMDHSKSAGGWLGARSAARRAMALGEYDWKSTSIDKYGRQVDYSKYKGPKDYLASPYLGKYQFGGLIYNEFIKPKQTELKNLNLSDLFIDPHYSNYPVEPVSINTPKPENTEVETPKEQEIIVQETPVTIEKITQNTHVIPEVKPLQSISSKISQILAQSDNTRVASPIKKGSVVYKTEGMDVGNLAELINLMVEEGVNFRVTSGKRPGSRTSSGRVSHHDTGDAIDITPINGDWGTLLEELRNAPKSLAYMKEHGYGILDERSPEMLARTGGTGPHLHIGPDKAAVAGLDKLLG